MQKQIFSNLVLEYEPYCDKCNERDLIYTNTLYFNGQNIQYMTCSKEKQCKAIYKHLSEVQSGVPE